MIQTQPQQPKATSTTEAERHNHLYWEKFNKLIYQDLRKQEPFLSVTDRQMKESEHTLTDRWQQKQVCRCHQCTVRQYIGVQMYCRVTVVAMAHLADRPHLDTAKHNTSVMTSCQNAIISLLLWDTVLAGLGLGLKRLALGLEGSGLPQWDLEVPSTSPVSCPLSSYHSLTASQH